MPNVQLEMFEGLMSIANPRLRDGSVELFVGRQAPDIANTEFNFRPLFSCGLAVVARQGHPLAQSRSLADLMDADWLVSLRLGHGVPSLEEDVLSQWLAGTT
ncbi:LysR substrate-binding domain-containing protein (plasmid) [Paraburkholderia strydomiana]